MCPKRPFPVLKPKRDNHHTKFKSTSLSPPVMTDLINLSITHFHHDDTQHEVTSVHACVFVRARVQERLFGAAFGKERGMRKKG